MYTCPKEEAYSVRECDRERILHERCGKGLPPGYLIELSLYM